MSVLVSDEIIEGIPVFNRDQNIGNLKLSEALESEGIEAVLNHCFEYLDKASRQDKSFVEALLQIRQRKALSEALTAIRNDYDYQWCNKCEFWMPYAFYQGKTVPVCRRCAARDSIRND